jgi:hypothetical protein
MFTYNMKIVIYESLQLEMVSYVAENKFIFHTC